MKFFNVTNIMKESFYFDYIILGAGISGLYTYYKLKMKFPFSKIIILDKNDYIGGRALCVNFYGTIVSLGAGIIRPTDKHLIRLCKKLNLDLNVFEKIMINANGNMSPKQKEKLDYIIYQKYLENYKYIEKYNLNFIQFLNSFFDSVFVNFIIKNSDYTDYLDANVQKTVEEYPLNEILISNEPRKMLAINGNWIALINKLTDFIKKENIILNEKIYYIKVCKNNSVKIKTENNNIYRCNQLFICGDKCVENIHFVNCKKITNIMQNVGSVPFTRIYAYFKNESSIQESIKKPDGWQDKMIPITKNITMIAYNDSEKAEYTNKIINTNSIDLIKKMTGLPIDDFIFKYWQHGVHYYKQNIKIKNKWSDIIIILGEMVSKNQGWVEGCIESVDHFFNQ